MHRTWTLSIGLALLVIPGLRADDSIPVAPPSGQPCCTTAACGKHGHDFRSWLTYCPKGRQTCTECSCLSRHGQRYAPLFVYFLDYPCPNYGGTAISCDVNDNGHMHYTKHACNTCASKSASSLEATLSVPPEPIKVSPDEIKKMPAGDAK